MSCARHIANQSDISLRQALLQAGWPHPKDQTARERTLENFVIDWDFEYPPEEVSTFNYFAVGHPDSWKETCKGHHPPSRARIAKSMGLLGDFSWESPRFFVTDKRGYAAVARHVAKDVRVHDNTTGCPYTSGILFHKTVHSIHYNADNCTVENQDGSVFVAKYCICTFSSGVINTAHERKELFYPLLPDWKAEAYGKAKNGIYTKIFLRYNVSFWADADYVLYAHPDKRGYYAVWQDMESHRKFLPQAAHILMVTVLQDQSRAVETQPRFHTINEIQTVLRSMYGPGIPEPVDIYIPKWNANPAFRGCWSNIAVGTTQGDFQLMQKNLGTLHFAGEATDGDFNGFTLGGYTSGQRAAAAVLEDLRRAERV